MTTILAIESSCDETSAAVVVDGRRAASNVVASQQELHAAATLYQQAAAYAQHRHPFPYEDDHYWQLDNLGTAARPVITRGAYYAIEKVDEAPPEVADMVDIFMVAERHRPTLGLLGPVAQARSVPGALMP